MLTRYFVGLMLFSAGCAGEKDPGTTDSTTTTTPTEELPQIFINEFMASNTSTLADEAGAYPDWIELYNPNATAVDLSGWWLTDDTEDPFNWQFPDGVSIPANGFIVIFADNDTDEGDLHASFNLAATGEDIVLLGPNVLDNPMVDIVEDFAAQLVDVSLARSPDGANVWQTAQTPTPGASNN